MPSINIPPSTNCVDVQIIDTTTDMYIPAAMFVKPIIGNMSMLRALAWCFYIENPRSNKRIVFDLGLRKDPQNLSRLTAQTAASMREHGAHAKAEKNVAEVLVEQGVKLENIQEIVWSHHHLDHTGDPSTFPGSTDLVVGPGVQKEYFPGYPAREDSAVLESDYKGRNLREISFDGSNALEIGGLKAIDYFGDGSFYLLDVPGHTVGHMCGLARTTPDTFILMGADSCHHCGEMRPTPMLPMPNDIMPNPLDLASRSPCPCSMFVDLHPNKSTTEPYMTIAEGPGSVFHDTKVATESLEKLKSFDADDKILLALAHDSTLKGIVDEFPKSANDWQQKGWKEASRWKFLADFKQAQA